MIIKLEGIIRTLEQYSNADLANMTVEMSSHRVWLNNVELDWKKSLAVSNHSPSGLNWGYGGSGPSQFALAVCIELFGIPRAQKVYKDFKNQYISSLPFNQDFAVELDLSSFIVAHEERFKRADQEAEEDRLWRIEMKQLEEEERKQMEQLPEMFNQQKKELPKMKPDLIERFTQLVPIRCEFPSSNKRLSACNLIVNEKNNLVIATEIEDNPGPSITNAAEALANYVCINFNLNKSKFILIEHYSNRSYQGGRENKEDFALVSFQKDFLGNFRNPEWSFLSLQKMEEFLALLD